LEIYCKLKILSKIDYVTEDKIFENCDDSSV